MEKIKPREREAIIKSLRAGVVPSAGIHHIRVGRNKELKALMKDIENIASAGSAVRFIIGEYGAGKTFFLKLVHQISLQEKLVVVAADLAPNRCIHDTTRGRARNLYAELMKNLATKSKPNGGALQGVIEAFICDAREKAQKENKNPTDIIEDELSPLRKLVSGFDFTTVLKAYWRGYDTGNEPLKMAALRWLKGEYTTKTEARKDLDVRTIIDDTSVYDHLKLLAQFVRIAGYNGLMVSLDEMVNIYKINNSQTRSANYEQILRIINDVLQGNSSGIGFIFGGTPEFLTDTRRGVYSYEALRSRLDENPFAREGLIDLSGPVIRLNSLTKEDFYVLLTRIRGVFFSSTTSTSNDAEEKTLCPDEALEAFMSHCYGQVGAKYFTTPRTITKGFVGLLSLIDQNRKEKSWKQIIPDIEIEDDRPALDNTVEKDDLTSFQL